MIQNGDASISWHTRYIPQQTYNNNNNVNKKQTQHRTQGPRFKPSVAITTDDQTEFKPFQPNTGTYKTYQTNHYVPKITQSPTIYQYFNTDTTTKPKQPTSNLQDNYSYFNLGGESILTTPSYTTSSTKLIQHYYNPKNSPTNYSNQPQTQSSHVQYINNHRTKNNDQKIQPHKQHKPYSTHIDHKEEAPENKPEYENDEETHEEDDKEEVNKETYDVNDIKPSFPPPPDYYLKPVNKYENIENPFADPNFDFDKFLERLREGHNYHAQHPKPIENESKPKPITYQTNKFGPDNVDLRKPVAFSSPAPKDTKKPSEDDYYYDDEIEEKPKKYKEDKQKVNTKPEVKPKPKDQKKEEFEDDEEYEYYDDYEYVPVSKPNENQAKKPVHLNHNPVYTNTHKNIQPSIKQNIQPNIQPSIQNNIKPNIQPNVQKNIQPNLQLSLKPNTQPIQSNIFLNLQPNIYSNTQPNTHPNIYQSIQPSSQPNHLNIQNTHLITQQNSHPTHTNSQPTQSSSHTNVQSINTKPNVPKPAYYEPIYKNTSGIDYQTTAKPIYTIRPRQKPSTQKYQTDSSGRYITSTNKPIRDNIRTSVRHTTNRPYTDQDKSDFKVARPNSTDDTKR